MFAFRVRKCYVTKELKCAKSSPFGFSLVELLVVVAILAILAAIAIPLFLNQRSKAAQGAVQSDARNLATNVNTLFTNLPRSADPNVALNGSTAPNATLSGSGTIAVGGETLNVNLSPDVTITKTGNEDPTLGAGFTINHAGVENWACVVALPASVAYAQKITFQPKCGTIISEEGNLLPVNIATGGGNGLSATSVGAYSGNAASLQKMDNEKIALEGSRFFQITHGSCCSGGLLMLLSPWVINFDYAIPVGAEKDYTFVFAVRGGDTNGTSKVHTVFHKEDGGSYTYTYPQQGDAVNVEIGTWNYGKVLFTVPDDVSYVTFWIGPANGTSFPGGTHTYYDQLGVWEGHGGQWETPGVPIVE